MLTSSNLVSTLVPAFRHRVTLDDVSALPARAIALHNTDLVSSLEGLDKRQVG